jgi:hypothetical protein
MVRMVEAGRRRRVDGIQVRHADVAVVTRLQIGFFAAEERKKSQTFIGETFSGAVAVAIIVASA